MNPFARQLDPFVFRRFDLSAGQGPEHSTTLALSPVYSRFNGGLFWGGALLIRPAVPACDAPRTIAEWNDEALWKNLYENSCRDVTFFAEDAFGIQFGIRDSTIVQFDPETAEIR